MTLTYAFDPVIAQWGPLPGAIQAERKVEARSLDTRPTPTPTHARNGCL